MMSNELPAPRQTNPTGKIIFFKYGPSPYFIFFAGSRKAF